MKAIILNSGMGSRLEELTENVPKSMININNNQTIFSKTINTLKNFNIDEFIITTGYLKNVLKDYALNNFPDINFTFVDNPVYDSTNYIKSLDYIEDDITDDLLLLHGDLVFDEEVVTKLIKSNKSSMVVDSQTDIPQKDFKAKVVDGQVKQVSVDYFGDDALACQPLYKLLNKDWIVWKKKIREYCDEGNTNVYAEEALNELLYDKVSIDAMDIQGYYCSEIDTKEDLRRYQDKFGE
ncbi:MAG: phosphocholine cytidylyltransferase family protein [Methanosphaera stadtmanae]|jgi:phosphoenolpyruvate phosphomutase|nr:phosphocholine cytidylyltransferase family protein [Methanosphaera stadtmanae]